MGSNVIVTYSRLMNASPSAGIDSAVNASTAHTRALLLVGHFFVETAIGCTLSPLHFIESKNEQAGEQAGEGRHRGQPNGDRLEGGAEPAGAVCGSQDQIQVEGSP